MKYVALTVLFLTLVGQLAPAHGQQVPRRGLTLPIRVTGTIPRYLALQATQAPDPQSPLAARVLTVLVRANCPWTLKAETAGVGLPAAIEQVGQSAPPLDLMPGQPATVPCRVGHFAGEHLVQFRLISQAAAETGAGGDQVPLRLWLEAAEGAPMRSEVVEVR